MKSVLTETLKIMFTKYCKYKKENKELLAMEAFADYRGFRLGLLISNIFSEEELDEIENKVKLENILI